MTIRFEFAYDGGKPGSGGNIDPDDDDIDGLPTAPSMRGPGDPETHPNGTIEIDHIVVMSHAPERTKAELEKQSRVEKRLVHEARLDVKRHGREGECCILQKFRTRAVRSVGRSQ